MFWVIFLALISSEIPVSDQACSNPLPLSSGTWRTSNRGTWVVNTARDRLTGFTVTTNTAVGPFTTTMICEDDTTDAVDGYVLLKSSITYNLFGGPKYIYACIKFEPQTTTNANAYYFYMSAVETTLSSGSYERIILLPSATTTFDFATLCNQKSTAVDRTHVAIKEGTQVEAALTCPTSIHGTFSYTGTSCSSSFLDVCSTLTEFIFNYTVCAEEQFFSASGQFYCVLSGSSGGNNYLTLYNNDTSVDSSTFYQFACLVYSTNDRTVQVSVNPQECFSSDRQTPTSTLHTKGQTLTLTNYGDSVCYDTSSDSSNLTWLYVLIAIIILLIIIALIILAIWYFKYKKEKTKKSDEEAIHVSDVEDEDIKQVKEERKPSPIIERKKEKIPSPIPEKKKRAPSPVKIPEDDRTSIDSGIQQDKKEEKKVVIDEDAKKKEEKDKKEQQKEEDEESSSDSESVESSRVTTPEDPEVMQRKIQQIGIKKTTEFKPKGELHTVLVSRKQQEKKQTQVEQGKWKKMKDIFSRKKKKIKDNPDDKSKKQEIPLTKRAQPGTKDYSHEERAITPFKNEYQYKKKMQNKLEESYTWGKPEDYSNRFQDEDDEEFEDALKALEQKHEKQNEKHEQKRVRYQTESRMEKEKKQKKEDQAKDSGVDSPDLKKVHEMTELPPGYIRDSAGQIIRSYDGKVMTDEEIESIFQLAKVGQVFNMPRLKRTAEGRPTGEYLEDSFGPVLEKEDEKDDSIDLIEEYNKPIKRQKSAQKSPKRDHREHKSVAFDVKKSDSDIMIENDETVESKDEVLSKDRELLRSRLFKKKRKPGSRGRADDNRPRELSDLVKVIPQSSAKKYAVSGNDVGTSGSRSVKFDPEQQQAYREGLAKDKSILERSPSVKRRATREAFVDQEDIRITAESPESQVSGFNLGSDDEFFLVGDEGDKPERFFTQVRRPGETTVRPLPNTNDWFCPKHDMRHALPWSLINQYQIRESSILDANSVAKKSAKPNSADNAKRKLDDRRLKELLEELYKDKKYFDHMIDTTEPSTEPIIDERDLAEHGREFLMERAEYWDDRVEGMPRPPQTALGLQLSRMNTQIPDTGRHSNLSFSSTITPRPMSMDLEQSSRQKLATPFKPRRQDKNPQAFLKRENTFS